MDYTKRLFAYFDEDPSRTHLIIAPGAPPIERSGGGVEIAMEAILDGNDVTDTLVGLRTHGETKAISNKAIQVPDQLSDVFCLSIRGSGRFRVHYLTQRGSKTISIERIPFTIPSCADLNIDAATAERALRVLKDPNGGIVALFGPSPSANSKAVYALLKSINSSDRNIILIMERELTHLMRHDNSVVVQRELGADFTTLDDGIQEGLNLSPHILFVGDLLVTDRLPSLIRAIETQTCVILSIVASDHASFLHIVKTIFGDHYPIFNQRTQEILHISQLPEGGLSAVPVDNPSK